MICHAADTRRAQKLARREIYATAPSVTQYLDWSDSTITFDRSDHPDYGPHPGKFPLVLDLIIGGFCLSKVLMDGGSGINILFINTIKKMGISPSRLSASPTGFHGFIPGKEVQPFGQISLEVIFGEEDNF